MAVEVGLARIHPDHESVAFERAEPGDAIAQRRQVEGDHIIGIAGEDLGSELPSLGLIAQAEQVLAELDLGGLVVGIELERPPLVGRSPRRTGTSARACGRSGGRPPGCRPMSPGPIAAPRPRRSASFRRWASTAR